MLSTPMVGLCCIVAVFMLLQQHSEAKPYFHSKKTQFGIKDTYPDSPFAPPAFYDEEEDYSIKEAAWKSWTPAQPKQDTKQNDLDVDAKLKLKPKEPKEVKEPQEVPVKEDTKEPVVLKFADPCKTIYCKYGRVCQADKNGEGECVCAGVDFCQGHSKQVCGSDGVLYPSHCELHRMACVKGSHIGIDHSGKRCAPAVEEKTDPFEPKVYDIEVTKEKIKEPEKDVKITEKDPNDLLQNDVGKDDDTVNELEKKPKEEVQLKDTEVTVKDTSEEVKEIPVDDSPQGYKSVTDIKTPCQELEYERLKSNLLQYHCARIGEMDCTTDPAKKQFVANIMFNYYDLNANQLLTESELKEIERRDHLEKLSRFCRLADFLTFNDREGDGNMSMSEFYSAFKIPTVVLNDNLKVFTTIVTTGNSVELKCDIKGAEDIIWKRNGATLDELISDDIQVFEDGSLYLKNIGLHHIGNYTCQDRFEDQVTQTHVLKVQMTPKVRVSPSTQFHTSGSSVILKCHADGVPEPEIMWDMNEAPLTDDSAGKHYMLMHNNATLEIKQATYTKDTGAYKCKARNSAGVSQDIATVFIENSKVPQYSNGGSLREVFIVFHDKGYTVYEPNHCHMEHQVGPAFSNFDYLPEFGDTPALLCAGEQCSWGDAVNIKNKFIYISQPSMNRVVVIEITDRTNPVEIINTDKFPVKLHYIEHLDQVWVLCWNQADNTGSKTAVVIRDASESKQHHIVHTQPVGNRFDLIDDFFLPPSNDLKHSFDYGYVHHVDQQGIYKMDLQAMQYVKNIDLKEYSCIPKSLAFIPMGGQVIVHCQAPSGEPNKPTRIVLDYVTDKVLEHTALGGEPYLSPDARHLVTVETDGNTISVSKLKDDGKMEHVFDEYTNLRISDVTFFPSQRGHGYDFFASANNKNDVLFIDLDTGKVEMIEGVGEAMEANEWPWDSHNRVITSGGIFGEYLMTPSKDSVVIIDGMRRLVQCEWENIKHGNVIIWVDPMHL